MNTPNTPPDCGLREKLAVAEKRAWQAEREVRRLRTLPVELSILLDRAEKTDRELDATRDAFCKREDQLKHELADAQDEIKSLHDDCLAVCKQRDSVHEEIADMRRQRDKRGESVMTRESIFAAIDAERLLQDGLYSWANYTEYHKAAVLGAQAGKATDSILPSGCHAHSELRRRLTQTAAVAVRWLEELPAEEP